MGRLCPIFFMAKDRLPSERSLPSEISDVNIELLTRFLVLFRDNYERCDQAVNFLEQEVGIASISSITNQRDALSHFATALKSGLSNEERKQQFYNAEEHLRRAIIDPYQVACSEKYDALTELVENYKRYVIPLRQTKEEFRAAPNDVSVNSSMKEITLLLTEARKAKAVNRAGTEWEAGILNYILAFERMKDLHDKLEGYWFSYLRMKRDSRQSTLAIAGFVVGAIGVMLAILFYFLA